MLQKKSKTLVASAVSLALSSMMLAGSLHAGKISDMYLTGVGAFDLSNVTINQVDLDGNVLSVFTINADGTYLPAMAPDTSFVSLVYSDSAKTELRARLTGKDYPIGEPTGIKAINDDTGDMRADSPKNCLLSTSYITGNGLNIADPVARLPTLCSSDFQSHKRFKVSMLDTTFVADGADGKPIDLTIKVADETPAVVRPYQVFSKVNNYTGKRLSGYKIQVGRYDGAGVFKTASELGLRDKIFISLGLGEGTTGQGVPNGSNIFDPEDLATFSYGLFGDASTSKYHTKDGFFDDQRAGFYVQQTCSMLPCTTGTDPTTGALIVYSDTIQTAGAMDSNYVTLFGDWLHQGLMPMGLFYDDDDNRETDDVLQAWWNGTEWVKPAADRPTGTEFVAVSATEFNSWANAAASATTGEKPYYAKSIEDVLNLGPNYILKVGDGIGGDFVIRIIPMVADATSQDQPAPWMANIPAEGDLVPVIDTTTPTTSSGGGGCAIGGNGRFDPTLPALAAAGLVFFGLRRFKSGK